jgi:hypothetical protein
MQYRKADVRLLINDNILGMWQILEMKYMDVQLNMPSSQNTYFLQRMHKQVRVTLH